MLRENIMTNLSLKKYFLEELTIKAPIPSNMITDLNVILNSDTTFERYANDESIFKVIYSCNIEHKEYPDYKIEAKITGIFQIDDCDNKTNRDCLLSNGATSALYGILREIIRSTTSMTLYPPLILPIIYFEPKEINFKSDSKNLEKK